MTSYSEWGDTQAVLVQRWRAAQQGSSSPDVDVQTTPVEVEWRTHHERTTPLVIPRILALVIGVIDWARGRTPGVAVTVRSADGEQIARFRLSTDLSPLRGAGCQRALLIRWSDVPNQFLLDVDGTLVSPLPGALRGTWR